MADRIPHDYLFKELLSAFLHEFLQLFVPDLAAQLEPGSLRLLDKELYPEWLRQQGRRADLVAEAKLRGRKARFVIHLEHEAASRKRFPRRMFYYYARFHEKGKRVYPVVVYSYPRPRTPGRDHYKLRLFGKNILMFRFHVVQLNLLDWRDFLRHPNPLASALMVRMHIIPQHRPASKPSACDWPHTLPAACPQGN